MGIPGGSVVKSLPAGQEVACHTGAAVKPLSRVRFCATPQTAAHQAPLSMGWSRQECSSELPLPSLATQETLVQFLGREDPLEKEMAIHSRILA